MAYTRFVHIAGVYGPHVCAKRESRDQKIKVYICFIECFTWETDGTKDGTSIPIASPGSSNDEERKIVYTSGILFFFFVVSVDLVLYITEPSDAGRHIGRRRVALYSILERNRNLTLILRLSLVTPTTKPVSTRFRFFMLILFWRKNKQSTFPNFKQNHRIIWQDHAGHPL